MHLVEYKGEKPHLKQKHQNLMFKMNNHGVLDHMEKHKNYFK